MKTDWGAVLSELRNEQGLSQREAARVCGVSRSSLRRIELGQSHDLPMIETILSGLGYELDVHPKSAPAKKDHDHGEALSRRHAVH